MGFLDEAFDNEDGDAELPEWVAAQDAKGVVKYTDGRKYEVKPGAVLSWELNPKNKNGEQWRGLTVDSDTVISYYLKKWSDTNRTKPKRNQGAATTGLRATPQEIKQWSGKALIWVIGAEGKVYSHIPKLGRFHHSSFLSGAAVKSAGMWIVKNGVIKSMAPLSGHYRPTLGQFMEGVRFLKDSVRASKPSLFLHFMPLGKMRTVPYETWASMSYDQLYRSYKSNPREVRPVRIQGNAGSMEDLQYSPTYSSPAEGVLGYPGFYY